MPGSWKHGWTHTGVDKNKIKVNDPLFSGGSQKIRNFSKTDCKWLHQGATFNQSQEVKE